MGQCGLDSFAQNRDQWRAVISTVIYLRVRKYFKNKMHILSSVYHNQHKNQ
jgi:hypothetical protein